MPFVDGRDPGEMNVFETQYRQWQRRKRDFGDRAVGRRDESVEDQGKRIAKHIGSALKDAFFEHGLDFGCGWGRLSGLLVKHCGHLWVADLFNDWVARAMSTGAATSPVVMRSQKLPLDDASMDLVVDAMTIQSIDNDALAREAMHELRRVARPGATVISLHVIKPRAPTRTAPQRAAHLGLSKWEELTLNDVDRANEDYSYLVGMRV